MNIEGIEMNLRLHLAQLIFEWCLLEDWVFPTVSIYANNITFHLAIHKMAVRLTDNAVTLNPKAFKSVGIFCYKFLRKSGHSQQYLEERLRNKAIDAAMINKLPEISYMTIILNTEIYHCLASANTSTKRQVVERMTFNMEEKRFNKVANEELSKIKIMTHRKLNLEKGVFKFTFTDILLMRDILDQIFTEREYIGLLRSLTVPKI
jgi:hypothetical protein